jgi:toxin CptA
MLSLPTLLLAALLVALMGFAVQRGATCMVAAVDEIMLHRRAARALAMLEAGLWVGGILGAALLFGSPLMVPSDVPILWPTLAGAVLLGLGAHVNRACVFGAIARLGSGEWAYLCTPLGLLAGCLLVFRLDWVMPVPPPVAVVAPGRLLLPMVALLATLAAWRIVWVLRAGPSESSLRRLWNDIWSPRGATSVIGISFALLFLFAGSWTYPDALANLARDGMVAAATERAGLFVALLAGAVVGGWSGGRHFSAVPSLGACLRCMVGGALMGVGSLLVPGSNDGLLLLGLPLLLPYAAAALLVMCGTIAAARALQQGADRLLVARGG